MNTFKVVKSLSTDYCTPLNVVILDLFVLSEEKYASKYAELYCLHEMLFGNRNVHQPKQITLQSFHADRSTNK